MTRPVLSHVLALSAWTLKKAHISAGAIVKNLALNVNLSYCMDLRTLGSKLQKNSCWTFCQ